MDVLKPQMLVANWKMNPQTVAAGKELVAALKKSVGKKGVVGELVIAPPFPFLGEIHKAIGKTARMYLCAQDVSAEKMGARTGEVSLSMLQDMGVSHVIVGHSERRAHGETDSDIEKKVALTLKAQVTTILCVGERERDSHGKYFGVVETQVRMALRGVQGSRLASLAIAYEPVWAISTAVPGAHAARPEDAHEMILFIRKVLTDLFGRANANKVRILYGGSVDQKNIESFVKRSSADGYLVGGASLRAQDFASIIKTVYAG